VANLTYKPFKMVAHIAITMQQGAAIINLKTYARDNNIG
jgi:hypothetical protein